MNQQSLFPKDKLEHMEQNCYFCKHFSELKEPRELKGKETECLIYGYCFKDSYNTGKGYAVFLPEGRCEDFKKGRNKP